MNDAQPKNIDQKALWNGAAGQAWVESQDLMDAILQPFERVLVDTIGAGTPTSLLDVGCGTGSTTLAFAERLGPSSALTGIDISEPMLGAARSRLERHGKQATFVLGDAQTHRFDPASFEAIVSRFGVMFFDDPLKAFGNLRRATAKGGRLAFIAWRHPEQNPFMTLAERVAAPLLPNLPPRKADGPGQFAFADRDLVQRILTRSDWSEVEIAPIDIPCSLPTSELMGYLTRFGPVGRALGDAADEVRTRFLERARVAFESYVDGPAVRFTGACWMVKAKA